MQAKGSLTETNLRSLLEVAQAERATGTLTLRQNGAQATTLYFLFGHLFHAVGETGSGDDAVLSALNWSNGEFDFDAKAKLPADETVRSSIPELLERAGMPSGQQQARSGNASAPERTAPPAAPESPPAPEPSAVPTTPPAAWVPPAEAVREPERPPAPDRQPPEQARPEQPRPPYRAPEPRRAFKQRPQPRQSREAIPVPAGQVMYDSLKTSFVDFPRLITTLEREGHTGYVRLLTDTANGLLYFREGTALECVYDGGENQVERGKQALLRFNDEVTRGQGVLDVVGLSPELVDGLYELTVAEPIYTELYASWVDMNALLKFLEERKLSGSVMITANAGTGVIILTDGKLSGAYSSAAREVSDDANGVLMLCQDPGAMIEVKAASEARGEPLDVADVVGRRAPMAQPAPPPPPAPPPQAPPAPTYQPPPSYVQPPPAPEAPAPRPAATAVASAVDWDHVIADLQQVSDEQLGNRSRKVKDVLAGAERSQAGVEAAIDQIPSISILFVDASRLEALANDLRARLQTYLR